MREREKHLENEGDNIEELQKKDDNYVKLFLA